MDRTTFAANALQAAQSAALKVPTFNPVIAAAQACLESNFGESELATQANNLKGVKAGRSWQGETLELPTKEWGPNGWYMNTAKWRKYPTWEAAFLDYADLIKRVYPFAVPVRSDPHAFLWALVGRDTPKYATDPAYVEKVWAIVEQFYPERGTPTAAGRTAFISMRDEEPRYTLTIPAGLEPVLRVTPDKVFLVFKEPA